MKILWLVNIVMPELAVHLGRNASVYGGWLNGAMNAVKQSGNKLVICTTESDTASAGRYELGDTVYYISDRTDISSMSAGFKKILDYEKPDVIHIYGTEFEQSWAMAEAAPPERTLVTIQGSLIYCSELVYAGIPEKICRDNFYHRIMRRLNKGGISIELQKKSFEQRAVYEEKVLRHLKYINGGSEWGNSVTRSVNPQCRVLDCRLILRSSFYNSQLWNYDSCEKHSIYVLFSYPIKGFHKFLEALRIVKTQFSDVKVYAVANRLLYRNYSGIKRRLMELAPDYQWYVQGLIEKFGLKDNIEFIGALDEDEVKERLLKSNVFVSASAIENQSTALGEAMMLGVPSVASCVGAIQEMIDDGNDGLIYPFNEPHLLANNICRIFSDPELAKQFSVKGHEHAAETYNREKNGRMLLDMYKTIIDNIK